MSLPRDRCTQSGNQGINGPPAGAHPGGQMPQLPYENRALPAFVWIGVSNGRGVVNGSSAVDI
jgi:hypothetical protein